MIIIPNTNQILRTYEESFRASLYNIDPFRMFGLIDVDIAYSYGTERVTLAYYRSSGTNSHKVKGLWYPIVGIKLQTGDFIEFTPRLNYILSQTTTHGTARRGWLVKSLFFFDGPEYPEKTMGFSSSKHADALLQIGQTLQALYEAAKFQYTADLTPTSFNQIVISQEIYHGNQRSQAENYELLLASIYQHS